MNATARVLRTFTLSRERGEHGKTGTHTKSLGGSQHTPHREPVVAIVVILRIDTRTIDVQVVHIVAIVARRRPEVAVTALIMRRTVVEVARER